ncbi:hypothetical protein CHY_1788 [Carboxydothermus hydrogenoformans Z-2901]|uniref:Uncharacterized protein n=1 Tax=Carboxydothermus hydrogenoformans (strain ATCC BAA-161 / DSM 6008 / Z-2901) TaxID=246194 RepID=Q3AB76_CARHZ|nr:hypothetical protein CHY_1788 [Carboxydothermus hydrogenoformans Z-2901]
MLHGNYSHLRILLLVFSSARFIQAKDHRWHPLAGRRECVFDTGKDCITIYFSLQGENFLII